MNRLMKEHSLTIPEYEEVGGNFVVTFKRKYELIAEQVTEQVTEQVQNLLSVCKKEPLSSKELMLKLGLLHRPTFLYNYLKPSLEKNIIKMIIPDKPQSSKQKYVITEKGKQLLESKFK